MSPLVKKLLLNFTVEANKSRIALASLLQKIIFIIYYYKIREQLLKLTTTNYLIKPPLSSCDKARYNNKRKPLWEYRSKTYDGPRKREWIYIFYVSYKQNTPHQKMWAAGVLGERDWKICSPSIVLCKQFSRSRGRDTR